MTNQPFDVRRELDRIPVLMRRIELLNEELQNKDMVYDNLMASVSNYQFKANQLDSLLEGVWEVLQAYEKPWWRRRKAVVDAIENLRYLYERSI